VQISGTEVAGCRAYARMLVSLAPNDTKNAAVRLARSMSTSLTSTRTMAE
jgi:hypothetical protein